jgi:hypothetical protein
MAILDEKKEKLEAVLEKGSGCCGGASQDTAAIQTEKDEVVSRQQLDLKTQKKDKQQGSSCCG